jgi:protochlorophyllide reductase
MPWSEADIPDQSGRTALVTGATSGLGLRIAEVLAAKGARVLMTSRNPEKGERALARVSAAGSAELVDLDLGDLDSVAAATVDIRDRTGDHLDLVINNAGIMMPPLGFNDAGLEQQWATNVVGPAALTWQLLPAFSHVPGSRVLFTSSIAHWAGDFSAERLEKDARGADYHAFAYYGRTKLANLLLARELQKHFLRSGAESIAATAHPGYTTTELVRSVGEGRPEWVGDLARRGTALLGQSVEGGALPMLYAATEPGVRGSQYFGPAWVFETRGPPTRAARLPASRSDWLGAVLLDFVSEHSGLSL